MLADPPRAVKADEAQRAGTSEHASEEPGLEATVAVQRPGLQSQLPIAGAPPQGVEQAAGAALAEALLQPPQLPHAHPQRSRSSRAPDASRPPPPPPPPPPTLPPAHPPSPPRR